MLPESWLPPPEGREARRLAGIRTSLVRIRFRFKCQIHAVLAAHGVRPEQSDLFSAGGRRFLSQLGLPALSPHRVEANLAE